MRNLLITGAHHNERMKYATSLAMGLLCQAEGVGCGQCNNCQRIVTSTHPNVVIIEPDDSDTSDIKIEVVRHIIEENHKANFEKGKAVFIITHMHQITKAAANALLKSIEESGENKLFLALAPSRTAVLPTIASRLISVIIKPSALGSEQVAPQMVQQICAITASAPTKRFPWCEQFPATRSELISNLRELSEVCHALLRAHYDQNHPLHPQSLTPSVALRLSEALNQAAILLNKNVNPRLITEQLILRDWPYACL